MSKLIVLSSNNNKFLKTLENPIHCEDEYEIALTSLDLYYCFPNITKQNNIFRFSYDSGKSWNKITIPIGCYTLDSLFNEITKNMKELNYTTPFKISSNPSRVRTVIEFSSDDFWIDFKYGKSFGNLLGFDSIIDSNTLESKNPINILQINSIFIKTNLTETSIYNEKSFPFIYSFFPNALPGDKIIETPNVLIYHRLINKSLHNFEISLVDENDKLIDFNGETVTIRLHIRKVFNK